MRTCNSVRNFVVSIIFQMIMMVCGLIFPRQIIIAYGSSINGLTQTINQVINYLYLFQAGAVGASVYALYKPVAENDYEQINGILYATKRYFKKIGVIFSLCICLVAPILAWLESEEISVLEIIIAVFILGINASFSFFVYSWYDVLFQVYQQQYLFTVAQLLERVVYYSLLVLVINRNLPFLFMYVALLIGGIGRIVFLFVVYKKHYSRIIKRRYYGKVISIKNKGALLVNQIVIQAVDGAPVLIYSIAFGLKYASVFSVYHMVYGILKTIISTVFTSCNTSFANYVVTNSENQIEKLFNIIQFVFLVFGTWISFCCGGLLLKFILLYTQDFVDINYYYPSWAVVGVLYIAAYSLYVPYYMLTNTYGMFKNMMKPAIIIGSVSIVGALVLGIVIDPVFVIGGPLTYYFGMCIVRAYIAKKNLGWLRFSNLPKRFVYLVNMLLVSIICSREINKMVFSWGGWILAAFCVCIIGLVAVMIYAYLFERNEVKGIYRYALAIIFRKKRDNR